MATLETQSTKGAPVTVIYPAEKPSGHSAIVRFRVGKKTALPAYTDANLPHLVQFQTGQRFVLFCHAEVPQPSYGRKPGIPYPVAAHLELAANIKRGKGKPEGVSQWLG